MDHNLETDIAVQQTLDFQRPETKHCFVRINSSEPLQM